MTMDDFPTDDRYYRAMRPIAALIAIALALAGCGRTGAPAAPDEARVTIEAGTQWRLRMDLSTPVSALDLGPNLEGYRAEYWSAENAFVLSQEDGRDMLRRRDGRTFRQAVLSIVPAPIDLRKEYEPVIPMGDGGVLIYTGHFIPFADNDQRMDAVLTIKPGPGAKVSAFGETASEFVDWRSPFRHPAFVYIGSRAPSAGPVVAIVDATAPEWIASEVGELAPRLGAAFEKLLDRRLPVKPDIFVAIGDLSEPGRLSFSGDALPGQYQMTLAGGAFREPMEEARAVIRRQTAHEAAHLWQTAARPRSDAVPAWIHEGAADALAAEALRESGYWTDTDVAADLAVARATCIRALGGRSLSAAEAAQDWDAVYHCGRILNIAAAGPQGAAAFWREFVRRTAATGYDLDDFIALARESGGEGAAAAILDIVRISDARSAAAVDRALAFAEGAP